MIPNIWLKFGNKCQNLYSKIFMDVSSTHFGSMQIFKANQKKKKERKKETPSITYYVFLQNLRRGRCEFYSENAHRKLIEFQLGWPDSRALTPLRHLHPRRRTDSRGRVCCSPPQPAMLRRRDLIWLCMWKLDTRNLLSSSLVSAARWSDAEWDHQIGNKTWVARWHGASGVPGLV